MSQPLNLSQLRKKLPQIKHWLAGAGAEVLEPTNPWEVLRFRSGAVTSIVYQDKKGWLTYTGDSVEALKSFANGKAWRASEATMRVKVSPLVKTIRARDGDDCFACAWPVGEQDASADHLVPLTAGGPNHVSNLVLMHRDCNMRCGHMSAPEKVRMHVEARLAKAGLR